MKNAKQKIIVGLIHLFVLFNTFAGIGFDHEKNVFRVTDFPEYFPCTMKILADFDKKNAMNKISYNKNSGTYTIDAGLWIGSDDGTDTYFQIGSKEHPEVTIIINGNVVVYPADTTGKILRIKETNINRLTMGIRDEPEIKPILKIRSDKKDLHGLCVGCIPPSTRRYFSGDLHLYNSVIEPVKNDEQHAMGLKSSTGSFCLSAGSLRIINSRISWVRGGITKGFEGGAFNHKLVNSIFEDGKTAVGPFKDTAFKKCITGCSFVNCKIALRKPIYRVALYNCKFRGNDCNWEVSHCEKLKLIDCIWDTPLKGDLYVRSDYAKKKGWRPALISQRHTKIKVTDPDGNPVENAIIAIPRELEKDRLVVGSSSLNANKKEISRSEFDVLLTEFIKRATDIPNQPETKNFSYDITVSADGFKHVIIKSFQPTQSWKKLKVILQRKSND